jgi:hypothetical protein
MQCQVCAAAAENITRPGFDGLAVRCPRCGDFEVADSALNRLLRCDADERATALEKAKRFAAPRTRPCITTTCF